MAKRILIPTESYADWRRLLAKPDRHWKAGHSAMSLARAWEAAAPQGFPPEVASILASSAAAELANLSLFIALPEYQVTLPGGYRPSQTDVLAIGRGDEGLVTVAVGATPGASCWLLLPNVLSSTFRSTTGGTTWANC